MFDDASTKSKVVRPVVGSVLETYKIGMRVRANEECLWIVEG